MLSVAKTRLGMFQSQSQNIKEHSVRIVSTAFLLFFLITSPVRAAINGVAAVVNGEMITAFDLQAETCLLYTSMRKTNGQSPFTKKTGSV